MKFPVNKFTPQQYAYRLGVAEALAERDWAGHPEFEKWKFRYKNLVTGLSDGMIPILIQCDREKRVFMVRSVMQQGAPLDTLNILAMEF